MIFTKIFVFLGFLCSIVGIFFTLGWSHGQKEETLKDLYTFKVPDNVTFFKIDSEDIGCIIVGDKDGNPSKICPKSNVEEQK